MTAQDQRSSRRVPVALRIRLRYDKVEQFISKFAVNISHGGMFLASRNPKPIGTRLQFEMRLADDTPIIAGAGEVRWVKPYDRDKPSEPHGMGIEFTELSDESRQLIERILEHRRSLSEADSIDETEIPDPGRARRPRVNKSAEAETASEAQSSSEAKSGGAKETGSDKPKAKRKRRATSSRKRKSKATAAPEADQPEPDQPEPDQPEPDQAAAVAEQQPSSPSQPVSIESALTRARALASSLVGGDLDAELDAILQAQAVPREITIEAASRELAERLGGRAIETGRHQGGGQEAEAEAAETARAEAEVARAQAAEKARTEAQAAERARAEAEAAERAQASAEAAEAAEAAERARAAAEAEEQARARAEEAERARAEAEAEEQARASAARAAAEAAASRRPLPGVEPMAEDNDLLETEPRDQVTQVAPDPIEPGIDESAAAVPIEIDDVVSVLDAESGDEIEIDFDDLLIEEDDDDAPTSVG